jgi:glycosyltransferase involved in cell wall biosynthesis
MRRVIALVPARNEAGRVGASVRALRRFTDEVVVVDDASLDATAHEAEEAGARVIRLERRRGKGGALSAAVEAAAPAADDILVLADADLAGTAAALEPVLARVLDGSADLAIAAPPPGPPSGFGLVEGLARWGIRSLTQRDLLRPLSGQRALRAEILVAAPLAPGFGAEAALTIDAIRAGYRVIEVPVSFSHARSGRTISGFAHRARQGRDVAGVLARRFLRRSRRTAGVRR